ncbi:MAG: SDR family NAD(P)-dependent oxidoreductase [Spirochaetota bacterium]
MDGFVIITGAAGGLGRAFAAECAERGWTLFLTDLAQDPLDDLAISLRRAYGVSVASFACDLSDPDAREALGRGIEAGPGRPWMLLNVAGIDYEGSFLDRSLDELTRIVRLNVEATLATTYRVLELRDRSAPFRLVTVASLAGYYAMPLKATYAATKAFLLKLMIALNEELRATGGSATVLAPAGLATQPSAIAGIESQGVLGRLTTVEVPIVVRMTLSAALRGAPVVIPGRVNALLRAAGSLVPDRTVARAISRRWTRTRNRCRDVERLQDGAERPEQPLHVLRP